MSRLNRLWVYKPVEHVTTAGGENSFMNPGWLPVVHASVTTTRTARRTAQRHTCSPQTVHALLVYTRKLDLQVHTRHSTMPYAEMGVNGDINTSRKMPVYHGTML